MDEMGVEHSAWVLLDDPLCCCNSLYYCAGTVFHSLRNKNTNGIAVGGPVCFVTLNRAPTYRKLFASRKQKKQKVLHYEITLCMNTGENCSRLFLR